MRTRSLILILLVLLVCISCSRTEFSLNSVLAQPYLRQDGSMGLSLYVRTDAKDPESMQMVLRDPSGNLSWSFSVKKETFENTDYYGSSDIAMPKGVQLPVGKWSLDVLHRDGRTVTTLFDVSYTDVDGALERYGESDSEGAWFDRESNLTVI